MSEFRSNRVFKNWAWPAFFIALLSGNLFFSPSYSLAEKKKDSNKVFQEDLNKVKKDIKDTKTAILATDAPSDKGFDVKAPTINYDKDGKTLRGEGGFIVSGDGVLVESTKGSFNTETKDAELEGEVVFRGKGAAITASKGATNLEDETGEFENAKFIYDQDGFVVNAKDAFKITETRYKLFDPSFTTCQCSDGLCPWTIDADEARITQNGYVHAKNLSLWFHGIPLFYSPYFIFPAKMGRASGMLAPSLGYSSKDGFRYSQPVFVALDDSTDLNLTPFTESKTRNGMVTDFKTLLSARHSIEGKLLYSNESPRDGDLRGTLTEGLADPSIDDNRWGLFYNQTYVSGEDSSLPYRVIADVHRVSDGTMVKELPDEDIADETTRVATSTALVRSTLTDYLSAELLTEWNQAIVGPLNAEELTSNKLPELSVSYLESFRPISNPYGLRLVTKASATTTTFSRDLGYDGQRTTFNPSASVPFHVGNFFNGNIGAGAWARAYQLDNTLVPGTSPEVNLEDNQSNSVPYVYGGLGTAFERVYELPKENTLSYLASLGTQNQDLKLVRVKHVVEPYLKYTLVPDVSQDALPLFDPLDRIREKNLIRYGVSTSLLGRYVPRRDVATGIPETTPERQEFPTITDAPLLPEFGESSALSGVAGSTQLRSGDIRELLVFSVEQGYDWRREYRRQQQQDQGIDSSIYPFTDITSSLGLAPNKNFGFKVDSYYNQPETRFTGWGLTAKLSDDRDDSLVGRYTFVGPGVGNREGDPTISQFEGGLEAVLTERVRFGMYARYDDIAKEMMSSRSVLRLKSGCDCWHVDLGYSDKINPDKQTVFLSFTFTGLGDISQDVYSWGQPR